MISRPKQCWKCLHHLPGDFLSLPVTRCSAAVACCTGTDHNNNSHMADGAPTQARKRRLPGSMLPKPPDPKPEILVKSKKKKSSEPPSQPASPVTKRKNQVQTQLPFQKKPMEDRSHAFAVKPEPPKLPLRAFPANGVPSSPANRVPSASADRMAVR